MSHTADGEQLENIFELPEQKVQESDHDTRIKPVTFALVKPELPTLDEESSPLPSPQPFRKRTQKRKPDIDENDSDVGSDFFIKASVKRARSEAISPSTSSKTLTGKTIRKM